MPETTIPAGPHQGQPVHQAGQPLDRATGAMILVHGRGATAASILLLAEELDRPDFAYLAPQAAGNSWYPYSFLAPLADNEPGLPSGLAVLGDLVTELEEAGLPSEHEIVPNLSVSCFLSKNLERERYLFGSGLARLGSYKGRFPIHLIARRKPR